MAYVPKWERLADALKRVMSAGPSKHEAQLDICGATADRKIRVQYRIGKEVIAGRTIPEGRGIAGHVVWQLDVIPSRLHPRDFDWHKSCPKMPWKVPHNPVFWHLEWIELYSADVTRVLIATQSGAHDGKKEKSDTNRPARTLAKKALSEIWRGKVPDRTKLTDQQLCGCVQDWLKKTDHRAVSRDTILRAAGRRK